MQKTRIRIGVVSDVVCPWCYIGKRRLEKAMEMSSDRFIFDVEYFPFELDPNISREGVDYREYHYRKFGSEAKFKEVTENVKQVAAREGLDFRLDLQKTSPNTRDAHRVILVARDEGKQEEVVELLFTAYFTQGVDLTRIENLVNIAAQAGLDSEMIEPLLNSNTGNLEIEMAEKEYRDLGITSVPLFIIDNKFGISGAQSVESFTKAFEETALTIPG